MKNRKSPFHAIFFTLMIGALGAQAGLACSSDPVTGGLGDATYSGIENQAVTLSGGRWEGLPYVEGGASRPSVGLLEEFYLMGDLDADGQEETVVTLWQNTGGTGNNIYIAAMKPVDDGFENISTALVGDRVKLRDGKIVSGKIMLNVLQAGENDAMCCPTQLATRSWTLKDRQLEEAEIKVTGILSLNVLEGSEWILTRNSQGQPLPEDAEVTLSFDAGRISGKSACNRYSAGITEGETPGDILIGPVMGTRMACPDHQMEIESLYLKALGQVTNFSFHSGKLALNGQDDDGSWFSMLFVATGSGPHVEL